MSDDVFQADYPSREEKRLNEDNVKLGEIVAEQHAEIERLREQLRLANIDASNNEAEANDLRAEVDEAYQRSAMFAKRFEELSQTVRECEQSLAERDSRIEELEGIK